MVLSNELVHIIIAATLWTVKFRDKKEIWHFGFEASFYYDWNWTYSQRVKHFLQFFWPSTFEVLYCGEILIIEFIMIPHSSVWSHFICIWSKMSPTSGIWDHKKFDSKNFSTVILELWWCVVAHLKTPRHIHLHCTC